METCRSLNAPSLPVCSPLRMCQRPSHRPTDDPRPHPWRLPRQRLHKAQSWTSLELISACQSRSGTSFSTLILPIRGLGDGGVCTRHCLLAWGVKRRLLGQSRPLGYSSCCAIPGDSAPSPPPVHKAHSRRPPKRYEPESGHWVVD